MNIEQLQTNILLNDYSSLLNNLFNLHSFDHFLKCDFKQFIEKLISDFDLINKQYLNNKGILCKPIKDIKNNNFIIILGALDLHTVRDVTALIFYAIKSTDNKRIIGCTYQHPTLFYDRFFKEPITYTFELK